MERDTEDTTSGIRLTIEEKAKMGQDDGSTSSSLYCSADVERIPDFRIIDPSWLDRSIYKGEGNATFVVSLPLERKVLRFRKSDPNGADEPAEDGGMSRVRLVWDYYKNVISGLMGSYAAEPEIVRLDTEDLAGWMEIFEAHRPEHRRHKKVVETFATTLPDYTLMPEHLHSLLRSHEKKPTFCVEIKPKQGFVETDTPRLSNVCDYCRKQRSKVVGGEISSPSNYCPCDLFSGEINRMRRALRGLADSPQNNFRIFREGKLVYGEGFATEELDKVAAEWLHDGESFDKGRTLDTLFDLIREALLRPFPNDQQDVSTNYSQRECLPRNSVLERVLRVQRLNNHRIESVHRIYSTHAATLDDNMIYARANLVNEEGSQSAPSEEELLILRNYLLSRIARDCSILIAFREIDPSSASTVPSGSVIKTSTARSFLFNNAVTDLDPKSVRSIEKHYHRRKS